MVNVPEYVKIDDARDSLCLACIEGPGLSVAMRAALYYREQHVGQFEVEAVFLLPVAHCDQVDIGQGLADQLEVVWILEFRLCRNRHCCSLFCELGITQPVAARGIDDEAAIRLEAGCWDVPLLRRRAFQHGSGCCTGLAH